LTDADFMNPSPESLALVDARAKHYRLIQEKRAAELVETQRRHALIDRYHVNSEWPQALQKLLASRGLSLPAYVGQQRLKHETYVDALVRVLDDIEAKTQHEESAPGE
jgi:hypothetical protein